MIVARPPGAVRRDPSLRRLAAGAAVALAVGPGAVLAQSGAGPQGLPMGVGGSAPSLCVVTRPGATPAEGAASGSVVGPVGATVTLEDLVDPVTLTSRPATVQVRFDAACNYPHQVRLTSRNNALLRDGGGSSSTIAWAVPYTADLTWGAVGGSLTADAQSFGERVVTVVNPTPTDAPLLVDVRVVAGATNLGPNRPLGAGVYSDVLSVEVGPQ
jgi:hypothetical protein